MPHPSPYDLIHKATRKTTSADRWAALKVNAQERIPLTNPQKQTIPDKQTYIETEPNTAQNAQSPQAPYLQPPFPSPAPRHAAIDEIAQRHTQAARNALKPQAWDPKAVKQLNENKAAQEASTEANLTI